MYWYSTITVLRRKVDKEGGANFGITLPTKPDGGTSKVSDFIGFELRYNIPNTKFDFGVYGDIKCL
jgi:hypothetical protein